MGQLRRKAMMVNMTSFTLDLHSENSDELWISLWDVELWSQPV